MTTLIKRIVVLLTVTTLLAVTMGCNTTRGFGKDVESTGEGIQDMTN